MAGTPATVDLRSAAARLRHLRASRAPARRSAGIRHGGFSACRHCRHCCFHCRCSNDSGHIRGLPPAQSLDWARHLPSARFDGHSGGVLDRRCFGLAGMAGRECPASPHRLSRSPRQSARSSAAPSSFAALLPDQRQPLGRRDVGARRAARDRATGQLDYVVGWRHAGRARRTAVDSRCHRRAAKALADARAFTSRCR
jgi:hypothetical protein